MPEQSQVEATPSEQVEPAGQVEETTEVVEQVGQLLNQETQEETQETQEPEVKTPIESPIVEPVIDDSMIKEYPALKMYKGKPLKDLGKAYQNIVKAFTENQMRLKQIEKEQAKKIPEPSEIPDPVEKPEEFKKWLSDYTETIRSESVPQERQIDYVAEVRKILPQGVDVEKVMESWTNYNAERLYNEVGELRPELQAFYNKNPHILLGEIKSYYQLASRAEKDEMTIHKEVKEKTYNTIKNSIKKSQEEKENLPNAQFNQIEREVQMTEAEEILANILKIAEGQ